MRRASCSAFTRWLGLNVSRDNPCQVVWGKKKDSTEFFCTDAFIRDELSKGRYDPAISKVCFEMLLELFGRTLKLDLGEHDGKELNIEDVC